MHMEKNKEFIAMMNGYFGEFSAYELWFIFTNQNALGINTLCVQQNFDGNFYCTVDEYTVNRYKEEKS